MIVPLLLLLTSGSVVFAHPTADKSLDTRALGDLTDEQMQRLEGLQVDLPVCVKKCQDARDSNPESNYIPRCALTDQDTPEDEQEEAVKNAYSCMCTDKIFLADSLSCVVKNCASNSTAFDIALSSHYGMCKLYADIVYPKPETFLNDLCLLDDVPKGVTVPTDVSIVKVIWPDYTFAKDFPEKTATTWVPTGTPIASLYPSGYEEPKWTCTPTPLADSDSEDSSSTSTSSGPEKPVPTSSTNGTTSGNSTTKTEEGAANGGRQGLMGMAGVAAAVAGLAIFL